MSLMEIRDRVLSLPTLDRSMDILKKEIRDAKADVSKLLKQYEKERLDVDRMKKESLSSLMFKVIGKYEDKLRKEQREEIDAKLAYDRAVTHLETLQQDQSELAAQISDVKADKKAYNDELQSRRQELSEQQSEPKGAEYARLTSERNALVAQITEINQAQKALSRTKSTAQSVLKSLKSAENWATYSAFSRGGIISHTAKYTHIDDAERGFHTLSSQLRHLKTELDGVQDLSVSGISSGQRAVDFWFSNIFTSLSVRRKVVDNAEQVMKLERTLNTIETRLNSNLKKKQTELEKNKKNEEELLLSMCER